MSLRQYKIYQDSRINEGKGGEIKKSEVDVLVCPAQQELYLLVHIGLTLEDIGERESRIGQISHEIGFLPGILD